MLAAFCAWALVCAAPLLRMGLAPLAAAAALLLAAVGLLAAAWQARPAPAAEKAWRWAIGTVAVLSAAWATWAFDLDRVAAAEQAAAAAEQAADFEARHAARQAAANGWLVGDAVNTHGAAVYICTRAKDAAALNALLLKEQQEDAAEPQPPQEQEQDEDDANAPATALHLYWQLQRQGRARREPLRGTCTAVRRAAVQVRCNGTTGWVPAAALPQP